MTAEWVSWYFEDRQISPLSESVKSRVRPLVLRIRITLCADIVEDW